MELENALDQIAEIHRQMSLTRIFRGYRASTTFCTAMIALAAGVVQGIWLPNAAHEPKQFVDLWVAVAFICLAVVGSQMVRRFRRTDSPVQRQLTMHAMQQFLPCIVIGGMVTFLLRNFAHQTIWLLPGLWSIFFGLGIFASRQLLPQSIIFVGAFYLLWGLICMGGCGAISSLSPWVVAFPFAVGQSAAALILHWSLERSHES